MSLSAAASDEVQGELSAEGEAIALAHGHASETTMGGDDPVTFARLTEKALPAEPQADLDAATGKGGAMLALHLHASGRVSQVMVLHPKADPSWATELPAESVKVERLRLEGGRLAAVVASVGEVRADGKVWKFRVELDLAIHAD